MLAIDYLLLTFIVVMESKTGSSLVPSIPDGVELGSISTFNLWNHALRQQKDADGKAVLRDNIDIKTLLCPDAMLMLNMAPMDGPHPLYSNSNADLRTEFLLDHIIPAPVSPADERMTTPEGLSVHNLNGKVITFKKSSEGDDITVNGIRVSTTKTLQQGLTVYTLSGYIFDYQERTKHALEILLKNKPLENPFRGPGGEHQF